MRYEGGGGGRRGPYWRRQMGTTLPGEMDQQTLNLLNRVRARQGKPPLGGPAQLSPVAHPSRADLFDQVHDLRNQFPGDAPAFGNLAAHPPFDELPNLPGIQPLPSPSFGGGPMHTEPGPIGRRYWIDPAEQQHNELRETLLSRLQGRVAPPPGRDALRRYVQQAQLRRGFPSGGHGKPILPPRRAIQRQAIKRQARAY